MRILYIEDVGIYHRMMQRIALFEGHEITAAATGTEGLKMIQSGVVPDIIFVDINLPDVDGLVLTSQIRALLPDVPIIAITANAMIDDKEECLRAGATDYISKPFSVDEITDVLRRYKS